MDLRVLLILPTLYRRWASARLYDLQDWIKSWANEYMYAGVPSMGAADGWYQTAVQLEHFFVTGESFAGGAVDIMKCFDQIRRGLLYALAERTGMPKRILDAYKNYHEKVMAYNCIAGALGQPYKKPSSIPQGCPLSMMMLVSNRCGGSGVSRVAEQATAITLV